MRYRAAALLGIALLASAAAPLADGDILIFGGSDHDEFLGCFTCDKFSSDSIWNQFSQFGWQNQFGKWGQFGAYGSAYGSDSACNKFSSNPPILTDRAGNSYGYLSVNEFKSGSVCSAQGVPQVCQALRIMCAHK